MIKKQVILAILLIISSLSAHSQSVKIYRFNQIEFDSVLYYGVANRLSFEVFNSQGNKLFTSYVNLKVSLDTGGVVPLAQAGHFECFPPKIAFTYLNIFWQGKLLQKIKVKILPSPPARVYLTTTKLNGRTIDTNQPIPANQTLLFIIEPNSHLKSSISCAGRLLSVKISHQRMNKVIFHQENNQYKFDLRQFATRSGDKFVLDIQYEIRRAGACDCDFIGNEKLSFFVQ
jgi:hypothetical protein